VAKLEGERALRENSDARVTVLRLGVVYGPGQAPSMLIPQVVEALRAKRRIGLTPGTQTRDFVFVDDVAAAVGAALVGPAGTFNIASGTEIAVRDVVKQIAARFAAPDELLGFRDIAPRPGEAPRYVLDVTAAARELGWRATTSLAEGIARL
jgi:nucleoside-diphosphate-sugar epimerase